MKNNKQNHPGIPSEGAAPLSPDVLTDKEHPQKRNKRKIIIVLVGLVLIALIILRFVQTFAPAPQETAQLANVRTEVVKLGSITAQSPLTGRIEPAEEVSIIPAASGEVTAVYAKLGDYVSKGDVLFEIDKIQIAASYNQAKAAYELATRTYNNMKILYGEGAVSQNDYEQARVQLESALASYTSVSEAYKNTRVTSPISGYVTSMNVSVGSMAAPGGPVASIADISRLKISTTLSEYLVGQIKKGDVVEILVSSVGTQLFPGVVEAISPAPAQGSLTYPVEFSIQDDAGLVKAGMFAEIRIISDERTQVLLVPSQAVTVKNGEATVVVLKGKKPSFLSIKTGLDNGTQVEVISGLKEGDIVVVEGQQYVTENIDVNIIH